MWVRHAEVHAETLFDDIFEMKLLTQGLFDSIPLIWVFLICLENKLTDLPLK